jgi:hypothetical protein
LRAAKLEELQQVDDGGAPVELLRIRLRALFQLRHDIDERNRSGGADQGEGRSRRCGDGAARAVAAERSLRAASRMLLKIHGALLE